MNRGVVATLRDLVPIRPLTRSEAMRIAELQAQRFLELVGVREAPVPERVIAELPRVEVQRISPFPVSGATHWASRRWLVLLNGSEPWQRQRFSLAHEFKHILDHRFVDVVYSGVSEDSRQDAIEQICDYFAACVLMPRPWVKRSWYHGVQKLPQLADRFGVSQAAMMVRISQIGLAMSAPRCGNKTSDWTRDRLVPKSDRRFYSRVRKPIGVT